MESGVLDRLKATKLDYSAYGALPVPEDMYLVEDSNPEKSKGKTVFKQFEKLNYLRKNLRNLDGYIRKNNGESLMDWLVANKCGINEKVLEKIGAHNNETGGISAYFFNLQNYYDEQEHLYDNMEATSKMSPDINRILGPLREKRREKRKNRREMRRLQMKDMQSDGKGYLVIEVEEPVNVSHNANGEIEKENSEELKDVVIKPNDKAEEKPAASVLKDARGTIAIWMAGTLITLTVITIGAAYINSKTQ